MTFLSTEATQSNSISIMRMVAEMIKQVTHNAENPREDIENAHEHGKLPLMTTDCVDSQSLKGCSIGYPVY